jgi:hypothetical protein
MKRFNVYVLMMSFLVLSTTFVQAQVTTKKPTKTTTTTKTSRVISTLPVDSTKPQEVSTSGKVAVTSSTAKSTVQTATETPAMPSRSKISATPTLGANRTRSGANTQTQEMPVEIADIRVVAMTTPGNYTHRWEVDVRNKTNSYLVYPVTVNVTQFANGQSAGIAGGAGTPNMNANETKTVSGGFKMSQGVDRLSIALVHDGKHITRVFNVTPNNGANAVNAQEVSIEIVDARIIDVPDDSAATHRWEADVRNNSNVAVPYPVVVGVTQVSNGQIAGTAGSNSSPTMNANETKTITGWFKMLSGVDSLSMDLSCVGTHHATRVVSVTAPE